MPQHDGADKCAIVATIRAAMLSEHGCEAPLEAMCLWWAQATVAELARRGRRAIIQAGSLQWPRVRPADDDGRISTHFSYIFERDSEMTIERARLGKLPEMHVWAAIPDTGQIVDLTTRYLPVQAGRRLEMAWSADAPPDYLWATADELAALSARLGFPIRYEPDVAAIALALRFIESTKISAPAVWARGVSNR